MGGGGGGGGGGSGASVVGTSVRQYASASVSGAAACGVGRSKIGDRALERRLAAGLRYAEIGVGRLTEDRKGTQRAGRRGIWIFACLCVLLWIKVFSVHSASLW